ncbi:hypothetical protein GCM10027039_01760 [Terrabacter koreensis]
MTTKKTRPRTLHVWRAEVITPSGRRRPVFGRGVQLRGQETALEAMRQSVDKHSPFDVTAGDCAYGHEHTPPAHGCDCGVYAVTDLADLDLVLQAAEFQPPDDLAHLQEPGTVVLAEGILRNAIPFPTKAEHRLVPLLEDGTVQGSIFGGLTALMLGRPQPRVVGYGMAGDPATTVRGSSFTCERLYVRAEHASRRYLRDLPVPVIPVKGALATYATRTDERSNA